MSDAASLPKVAQRSRTRVPDPGVNVEQHPALPGAGGCFTTYQASSSSRQGGQVLRSVAEIPCPGGYAIPAVSASSQIVGTSGDERNQWRALQDLHQGAGRASAVRRRAPARSTRRPGKAGIKAEESSLPSGTAGAELTSRKRSSRTWPERGGCLSLALFQVAPSLSCGTVHDEPAACGAPGAPRPPLLRRIPTRPDALCDEKSI